MKNKALKEMKNLALKDIGKNIDYVRGITTDVLKQYVDEALLNHRYYGNSGIPPVSYEIAQDYAGAIRIRMAVRHDPFGQSVNRTEYKYYSWLYIDYPQIINQLFQTLTFEGSPYYWYKTHFKKRTEVMG